MEIKEMILGIPPGSNVYNLTTYPEAIVFFAIMAVLISTIYFVFYFVVRPYVMESVAFKQKCRKCPDEEKDSA